MAADAQNGQYVDPPFGMLTGIASTGAPGMAGITAEMDAGGVVGTPIVSAPFASSQVPENMPRLPVTAGDTCSMSSDAPVPSGGGDPMTGLGLGFIAATGAGQGSGHTVHPNSTARLS